MGSWASNSEDRLMIGDAGTSLARYRNEVPIQDWIQGNEMGFLLRGKGERLTVFRRPVSLYIRGFVYLGLILFVQFVVVGLVYLNKSEKVLFSGLNSDDVAEVSAFLKDKGVTFRITDAGSSVLVKGKVEELQKEFETSEWWVSKTNQGLGEGLSQPHNVEVNPDPRRLDAIRKELEKLLSTGSEKIAWARVGFPHEEKNALEEGEGKKGAAVFVGTGGQPLPSVDVERIQWVVANSIAGLKPSDVMVLNELGCELTLQLQD
jgi:flagellar biosynthesis/type III secretory pathway M-ring protein FliF/YscJ